MSAVANMKVEKDAVILVVKFPLSAFEYRDKDKEGKDRKNPIRTTGSKSFEIYGLHELGFDGGQRYSTRAQVTACINFSNLSDSTETATGTLSELDAQIARLNERKSAIAASMPAKK